MGLALGDSSWARIIWLGSVFALFLLALIAGGTARYGSPFNVVIELLSLPIVLVASLLILDQPLTRTVTLSLALCAGIFLLPLLQLIPLPPAVWMALPGRQFVADVFGAAGIEAPWMPVSLSPPATLRSLLSLFPPLAIYLATLTLRETERRFCTLALIGFGIISVPLGLAQIASGPDSELRLYSITNVAAAVGFFANRNHYAALLYAVMPFIAAWLIHRIHGRGKERIGWIALIVVIYGALILGLGMSASRAGIALAMAAILAGGLMAWRTRGATRENARTAPATRIVVAAGILGALVMLQFGLASILARVGQDPLDDGRVALARVSLRAAASVFPIGSGVGTFVPYYAMFERPADMGMNYANHAHNDWLELWLETGVPGMILALLFLAWFASATYRAWRSSDAGIDILLARAASLSGALLMIHSFVDYPLRTTALACLFAFVCAMVASATEQQPRATHGLPGGKTSTRRKVRIYMHEDREAVANSPQFRRNETWPGSI